jgi:hypothetical protein
LRDGTTAPAQLINIGVADINENFPEINTNQIKSIQKMTDWVADKIRDVDFDIDYDFALYTGELRFEKLSGYPLSPITVMNDANHPYQLTLNDFIRGTERIFNELSIEELYALMPENPRWMVGARAGAVLPLAVFQKAKIKIIVPSDINLINGVVNSKKSLIL